MNYTYRQLLEALQELSSDELDMHVTIYDRGREVYHPLNYTGKCEGDDVVDADHPIMIINDPEENVSESEVIREFSDVRSCEVWLEYEDGSEHTADTFLNMDLSIEEQIRETFEAPSLEVEEGSKLVNFTWKELGI
jgi:hypothetical protein